MRCPQCRREIPFEATEHAACGWKLASRSVPETARPVAPATRPALARNAPLPPELRAALDKALKKSIVKQEAPRPARVEQPVDEVTPGHGWCVCEICFELRMQRSREIRGVQAPKPKGMTDEELAEEHRNRD